MSESASIPIGLGMLGIGAVLLASGVTGNALTDILQGNFTAQGFQGTPTVTGDTTTAAYNEASGGPLQFQQALAEMDRITSVKAPYKWGGGHGNYSATGPWDCSGAVSQVLHTAGLLQGSPLVSGALMTWGQSGRGQYFTVYANPAHTFIIVEAGTHKGQAWGTSNSIPGGGAGWGTHTTAGFVARHYPGM